MSLILELPISKIREQLLLMASLTERNVSLALRAVIERNDALADTVEAEDSEIDRLEVQIDDMVIAYMATHGPVATDCRFMLTASKISTNMERVGDEATTIARQARLLNREPQLKPYIDIPIMGETAQEMLRESIELFVSGNPDAAAEVIARDKSVDAMNKALIAELTELMIQDPKAIQRGLQLMRISRSIERIADHAANVAEEVHYLYKARDLRHSAHR